MTLAPRTAYELKRFRRDYPDLAAQVDRGELKPWSAIAMTRTSLAARQKNPMENRAMKTIDPPADWQQLVAHEYANIFPLVPTDELKTTFPTMWETGYDVAMPVVLFAGKLLDGRNRLRAAIQSGQTPTFVEFEGDDEDALAFVLRANRDRRHLNDSQRAIVAAKIEPIYAKLAKQRMANAGREGGKVGGRGRPKAEKGCDHPITPLSEPTPTHAPSGTRARDQAAAVMNVSPVAVQRAKYVLLHAPEEAEKVEAGEKTVWQANQSALEKTGRKAAPTTPKKEDQCELSTDGDASGYQESLLSPTRNRDAATNPERFIDGPTILEWLQKRQIYTCQTEVHSRFDLIHKWPRTKSISAEGLAMAFDMTETLGILKSWMHYWPTILLARAQMAINEEIETRSKETTR